MAWKMTKHFQTGHYKGQSHPWQLYCWNSMILLSWMSLTAALSLSTQTSPVMVRSRTLTKIWIQFFNLYHSINQFTFNSCSSASSASPAFFLAFLLSFSTAELFFFTTAFIFLWLLACSLSKRLTRFLQVSSFDWTGVLKQSERMLSN